MRSLCLCREIRNAAPLPHALADCHRHGSWLLRPQAHSHCNTSRLRPGLPLAQMRKSIKSNIDIKLEAGGGGGGGGHQEGIRRRRRQHRANNIGDKIAHKRTRGYDR